MKIKRRKIEWYEERPFCDKCDVEMKHVPFDLVSGSLLRQMEPFSYSISCPTCGAREHLKKSYPSVGYLPVESPNE